MTDTFASGLTPYTDAERAADAAALQAVREREHVRRKAAPGADYARPGNPQTKARDLRIMGESE